MSGERDEVNRLANEFRTLCARNESFGGINAQVLEDAALNDRYSRQFQEYEALGDPYKAASSRKDEVEKAFQKLSEKNDEHVKALNAESEVLGSIRSYLDKFEAQEA